MISVVYSDYVYMRLIVYLSIGLIYNWENEFNKFGQDLKYLIINGNQIERYELLEKISNLDFAYIAIEEPKLYYVIIYYIVVFLYMIYKEAKTIKEQSHELQGYYK